MLVNISSSLDESLGVCLTNPRKEWFGPMAGLSMFVLRVQR
jgi:hypothetical protein